MKSIKNLLFGVVVAIGAISECFAVETTKTPDKSSHIKNFQQEIIRLSKDPSNKLSTPTYSKKDFGEFAQLLELTQQSLDFYEGMNAEIGASIEAFESKVSLDNVCEREKILEIKSLANQVMEKLDSCEKKFEKHQLFLESKINDMYKDKYLKELALKNNLKAFNVRKGYFQVERELMGKFNNLIDFIASKIGFFCVLDSALSFNKTEDQTRYIELVQELVHAHEKETQFSSQCESQRTAFLQGIENLTLEE